MDNTKSRIERRDRALRAVRAFFHDHGFVEADTPQLVPAPGTEPHIDPLAVDVRTSLTSPASSRRFLITSPELALKRVVAAGVSRVFQIVHVFRDGERTRRHLPEFTMVEWYRAPGSLDDILADTLGIVRAAAAAVGNVSGLDLDVEPERWSCARAFSSFCSVDLDGALDRADLPARVRAAGEPLQKDASFDDAFFHVMGMKVEPNIGNSRLALVEKWPASMAVLARLEDDKRYARRFELYGKQLELCNAFDELTDAREQRARFEEDNRLRKALGKIEVPLDEDFLAALPALPTPTAGNALGFDRLLMLLTGDDIDGVTALPWR